MPTKAKNIQLATKRQDVKYGGVVYRTFLINEKIFFVASEANSILRVGNFYQYVNNHAYASEKCHVYNGEVKNNYLKRVVSESALRRFAKTFKVGDMIDLVEAARAAYVMPIAKSTESDRVESVKPIETAKPAPVASVDPELKRMVERLQASNDALKAMVAKLQPKPSGYVDSLQRQSKNNITAKTTAQVAADYGYSLAEFKAKLVGFGMIEDNEMIELPSSLARQGRDILKNYPKITDEQLWTIKGQITLYELLAAKGVEPLIDKLNDIETVYNISI